MKLIAKGLSYLNLFFLMTVVAALDSEGIPASVLVECMFLSMVLGVLLAYYIDLLEFEEKRRRSKARESKRKINECTSPVQSKISGYILRDTSRSRGLRKEH